jgi:hypothetical protein
VTQLRTKTGRDGEPLIQEGKKERKTNTTKLICQNNASYAGLRGRPTTMGLKHDPDFRII